MPGLYNAEGGTPRQALPASVLCPQPKPHIPLMAEFTLGLPEGGLTWGQVPPWHVFAAW